MENPPFSSNEYVYPHNVPNLLPHASPLKSLFHDVHNCDVKDDRNALYLFYPFLLLVHLKQISPDLLQKYALNRFFVFDHPTTHQFVYDVHPTFQQILRLFQYVHGLLYLIVGTNDLVGNDLKQLIHKRLKEIPH